MRLTKNILLILFLSVVTYSCSNDEEVVNGHGNPVAVTFSAALEGEVKTQTKASGTSWAAEDQIGVFMVKNGTTLSTQNVVENANNISYQTPGNGFFAVSDRNNTVFYPTDNSLVDLIAYYPYTAISSDYIYPVNVSDQSKPEAIDLLYSNNSKGLSQTNNAPALTFSHQLARIVFNIKKGEGTNDLSGLKITFAGLPTKAGFNLSDALFTADAASVGNFDAKISADGTKGEAFIIPVASTTGYTVKFTLGSNSFTWTIPNNTSFQSGKIYTYNITLKNGGSSSVTPTYDYVETPVYAESATQQYVTHYIESSTRSTAAKMRNYSMLYDKANRVALWVAYPLHACYFGSSERTDEWAYDPFIAQKDQPDLFSSWPSFKTKNYNRGHQIASSDRTISRDANAATFYFSNMTLQEANFNGGTWNGLETKVQSWAKSASDTLYVVTGVLLSTASKPTIEYEIDNSSPARKSAIPQYFYKVLAKKSGGQYYTIGFRMPNIKPASGDSYVNYKVTVSDLEKETGFTFFPSIDQSAKTTIVASQWN